MILGIEEAAIEYDEWKEDEYGTIEGVRKVYPTARNYSHIFIKKFYKSFLSEILPEVELETKDETKLSFIIQGNIEKTEEFLSAISRLDDCISTKSIKIDQSDKILMFHQDLRSKIIIEALEACFEKDMREITQVCEPVNSKMVENRRAWNVADCFVVEICEGFNVENDTVRGGGKDQSGSMGGGSFYQISEYFLKPKKEQMCVRWIMRGEQDDGNTDEELAKKFTNFMKRGKKRWKLFQKKLKELKEKKREQVIKIKAPEGDSATDFMNDLDELQSKYQTFLIFIQVDHTHIEIYYWDNEALAKQVKEEIIAKYCADQNDQEEEEQKEHVEKPEKSPRKKNKAHDVSKQKEIPDNEQAEEDHETDNETSNVSESEMSEITRMPSHVSEAPTPRNHSKKNPKKSPTKLFRNAPKRGVSDSDTD
ncbi:unnamed protein product [Moneuplotes crassus]|uniref:Uncharacterized protein n=1 Tax=Euplotes crassus TaxID=5936 RepID=A0AAD2DBY8_EUPCR|nr:unnamed protein product [Moneuplotes crassus]